MKSIFKIFLIISLLFTMLLTSFQPVSANTNLANTNSNDTNLQQEEAINIIKSKINIPANYKLDYVSFSPIPKTWNFTWVLKENEKELARISVTLNDVNGEIMYLGSSYLSEINRSIIFPPEISYTEAKIIADNYIKDFYPDLVNMISINQPNIEDNKFTNNYGFRYDFLINGIRLEDSRSYVLVGVNGKGEVTNFSYSYPDELEFESMENIITLDEAKEHYSNQLNMNLIYMFSQEDHINRTSIPYVTYISSKTQNGINAKTGDNFYYGDKYQLNNYQPLVENPLTNLPVDYEKELSREEALKLAYNYLKNFTDKKFEFKFANYNSKYNSTTPNVWEMTWSNNGKDNIRCDISLVINAKNGELLYYSYRESFYWDAGEYIENQYPKKSDPQNFILTYDEAKEIAIETVKVNSPAKTNEVFLLEEKKSNSELVYFHFPRLINGIITDRDYGREGIRVGINLETGKIIDYYMSWNTREYPEEKPSVIEEELAKELLIKDLNMELVYYVQYNEDKQRLVYMPSNLYSTQGFLDAVSGNWRYRNDGSLIQTISPEDIVGHDAEKELQFMLDYRALDLIDGKVMPEKALTRGELIKMYMMTSTYSYKPYVDKDTQTFKDVTPESPYFTYIEDAVRKNIITVNETREFKPDEAVTREELARFIVRALGYDKLAQTDGIFIVKYSDQSKSEYSGHISIISSLGIMEGKGRYFYPDRKVTRADAATSFYNYFSVRNDYKEFKVQF